MQSTWAAAPARASATSRSTRAGQCHVAAERLRPIRAPLLIPRVASGHVSADGTPSSAQAVLDRYQTLLREYRLHKQALGDWFSGVMRQQRRQPQLLDAQATGDEALVARFQQYLMVRKRLLAEIPLMREQLDEALQQDTAHHSSSSSSSSGAHSSSQHGKHGKASVNANQATPVTKTQAVGQFFAAVNYRKQQGARTAAAAAAAAASAAAAAAAAAGDAESPEVAQAAAAVAALVSHHAAAAAASAVAAPTVAIAQQQQQQQQSAKGDEAAGHILSAATNSSSSSSSGAAASSRAAAAAMAAMAYKKGKQTGSTDASSSRQQRALAIQMAAIPEPPPGWQPAAEAADGRVESGKMGVVYAKAPQRGSNTMDRELSLEVTLQGVPGGLGGEQLFAATKVLSADAPAAAAAAASGKGEAAASHMLSAATSSSSSSAASGRASAAALAALAYKQRKQTGDSSSSSSSRQQRPLAIQMAAIPEPPPGWQPGSAAEAADGRVESGKMDVVYARAPQRGSDTMDRELSLEATLQGIPGGLGGELLFAATTVLAGDAAAVAAAVASGAVSCVPSISSSSSGAQQEQQQAGEVLTAKFDVYSGRRRVLNESQLDDFLAGLSEAYSSTPAAAAGTAAPDAAAAAISAAESVPSSDAKPAAAKQQQQQQQRGGARGGGFGGSTDGSSGPMLPPDILPVPT